MSPSTLVPPPAQINEDDVAMQYALGALRFRARSRRGNAWVLIWNDFAHVSFTLGLIAWKSIPQPAGIKRTAFLREFLNNCGVIRTKEQIWSRLDKLKKEWKETSYSTLLEKPDHSDNPSQDIGSADGSHQEPTASDEAHDLDLQHAESASQGSSSVSPNSPEYIADSQCPGTIVNEDSAPHPSAAWAPCSSQPSIGISGDQYIQGLNTYHEWNAVRQTAFDNPIEGYHTPFTTFE